MDSGRYKKLVALAVLSIACASGAKASGVEVKGFKGLKLGSTKAEIQSLLAEVTGDATPMRCMSAPDKGPSAENCGGLGFPWKTVGQVPVERWLMRYVDGRLAYVSFFFGAGDPAIRASQVTQLTQAIETDLQKTAVKDKGLSRWKLSDGSYIFLQTEGETVLLHTSQTPTRSAAAAAGANDL